MKRLLDGNPKHTGGRVSKANLGREAGVSHATLFRAKNIRTERDDAVTALGKRTHRQSQYADDTKSLRVGLAKKTDECAELRRRLEAAATVIATLHHENTALRPAQQTGNRRRDQPPSLNRGEHMTGPHAIRLDAGAAVELAELSRSSLTGCAQDQGRLEPSMLNFVGNAGYSLDTLHADLARFRFLLGDDSMQLFGQDQP